MGEKQTVQVTILHQAYTLRVSSDEREVVELADSVDQLMSAIAARAGNADSLRVAVLACLHMADRQRSLERDLAALKERVDAKSQEFGLLLDEVLGDEQGSVK
ncbi:MAG TPA: cell division protein ZapA [Bryobacteraceae bacterium]|nr:cell division protein ZapA [Bryobacteraceae bacterium]